MNQIVEQYLEDKRKIFRRIEEENRSKRLLELGLSTKEYLEDQEFTEDYQFFDDDLQKWYRYIPIDVTDAEYAEICKYAPKEVLPEKPLKKPKENGVKSAIQIVAYVIFAIGFIAGVIMSQELSAGIGVAYGTCAVVLGILMLGFAEIIKLLDKISITKSI